MTSAAVATAAASGNAVGLHLWHTIEAVGFLVVSLVGVSVSEWFRHHRDRKLDIPEHPSAGASRRVRTTTSPLAKARRRPFRAVAPGPVACMAIAGAGAAAVHYVVMPVHFAEAKLYGAFFLLAATAQLGYSLLLVLRPTRSLIAVGVTGNASMLALWLTTRLAAIPLGPDAGGTESFGGLDILASCFETLVIVAGVLAIIPAVKPGAAAVRARLRAPAAVGFAVLSAVAVTATACAAPPS